MADETFDFEQEVFTLTDEEGNESDFEFIGRIELDDNTYVALLPVEGAEDEYVILKVEKDENGEEFLSTIEDDEVIEARQAAEDRASEAESNAGASVVGLGGGTIIVGGGVPVSGVNVGQAAASVQAQPGVSSQAVNVEAASGASQAAPINPAVLADAIAASPAINIPSQFNGMTPEMEEATNAYVEQVKELTEVLRKVAEQSQRLTRDSEEMENMNRTLTGINSLYEIQLRSVSSQVGTIDDINAQTKRLAEQIEELNTVYARMLEALKMNMKA